MPTEKKKQSCGLIAKKWGPCFWMHMHMVAAGFPLTKVRSRRAAYMRYYRDIGQILPCAKCREHYQELITQAKNTGEFKNAFRDRAALQRFIFIVHNRINRRLNKPTAKEDMIARYSVDAIETKFRAKC